jgi:thiamine monophosphate synthase
MPHVTGVAAMAGVEMARVPGVTMASVAGVAAVRKPADCHDTKSHCACRKRD